MNFRFLDRIWHIQGQLPLASNLTDEDVFERLAPLFQQPGTTHKRNGDTLVFTKKDQAAQDKMSIFDSGVLQVVLENTQPVLSYRMKSRALLTCFFAPLVFLAFAQFAVGLNAIHGGGVETDRTDAQSEEDDAEEEEEIIRLHPIDQFLGAPEPKQPGDDKEETEEGEGAEEEEESKHSPGPAYVFAGIFALIYVVGRILEDWLIKRRFRRLLESEPIAAKPDG
ncbi:MAG: hypothetical protein AAFV59_07860 [Pseudomonadota bacterium]